MPDRSHILVVEDEQHLAFGIRFNLEAEGYQVSTAADGPTALDILMHGEPPVELVILDLMLPGMSGYDVCTRLRERGFKIPVLMLSARSLSEDRIRGFGAGADQYLCKPFELPELLARAKALLARFRSSTPASPLETSITVNGHEVDLDSYLVDGPQGTQLTALEMKLLRYFLAHPERVIPKSELLQEVWEQSPNVQTRAPDQFILRLRKIFEDDPSHPKLFLTIRDAGYRFVPSS